MGLVWSLHFPLWLLPLVSAILIREQFVKSMRGRLASNGRINTFRIGVKDAPMGKGACIFVFVKAAGIPIFRGLLQLRASHVPEIDYNERNWFT